MPYKERGKWRGSVRLPDGRRLKRTFETRGEALQFEADARRELKNGIPNQLMTVPIMDKYLDYAKLRFSERTYLEKMRCFQRFREYIGDNGIFLDEITTEIVHGFLLEQREQRSAHAANKDRKNLLAFWNWTQKILDFQSNPVTKTDKFGTQRVIQYTPPEKDILKLLAVADSIDQIFIETYLQTGARRSELFQLTWEDVDFGPNIITLWTNKTKDGTPKPRQVSIGYELANKLKKIQKTNPFPDNPIVFLCRNPKHRQYGQPYKWRVKFLPNLCAKAGIKPFGFHALRRFTASRLHASGKVATKTIQAILGHAALNTTEIYIHRITSDIAETGSLMEGFLKGNSEEQEGSHGSQGGAKGFGEG